MRWAQRVLWAFCGVSVRFECLFFFVMTFGYGGKTVVGCVVFSRDKVVCYGSEGVVVVGGRS